jgi:outer membrane lipoprotein SlyB
MTRFKPCIVLALVVAGALASSAVMAQSVSDPVVATVTTTDETWLGALAGAACGWMVRATIATGGSVVATIAGALATCAYMFFDALVVSSKP